MSRKERYVFLSRPRRFGKTLLVSTLAEIFEGNRELFEGLWIASSDHEWQSYPVIRLNFSQGSSTTLADFVSSVTDQLERIAHQYGYKLDAAKGISLQISDLIQYLRRSYDNKVVVLVDEYDSPLLRNLIHRDVAEQIKASMASFFGTLKSLDEFLHCFHIPFPSPHSCATIRAFIYFI